MKILIDAGHGIDTKGKRSPDSQFREYLFNRQVADLVIQGLERMGIDCGLVVTETNDIPLKTRAMRVNKVCDQLGKDNVILLSIHANASGDGSSWMNGRGWSCYTSKGQTGSDELAECLYDSFSRKFPDRKMRRDLSDGDSDIEDNFYILSKTKCRAVLIENFFYDNREECLFLMREETREKIADATIVGLLIYLAEI